MCRFFSANYMLNIILKQGYMVVFYHIDFLVSVHDAILAMTHNIHGDGIERNGKKDKLCSLTEELIS